MFKITRDPAHFVIDVKLSGFFEVAEAEQYVAEARRVFVGSGMHAGYAMLIDCSECLLQKQEVLAVFAKHIASFPKARRIAVITGSSLIKMQVKRIMTQPYLRIFQTRVEAHAWLMAKDKAAA